MNPTVMHDEKIFRNNELTSFYISTCIQGPADGDAGLVLRIE